MRRHIIWSVGMLNLFQPIPRYSVRLRYHGGICAAGLGCSASGCGEHVLPRKVGLAVIFSGWKVVNRSLIRRDCPTETLVLHCIVEGCVVIFIGMVKFDSSHECCHNVCSKPSKPLGVAVLSDIPSFNHTSSAHNL